MAHRDRITIEKNMAATDQNTPTYGGSGGTLVTNWPCTIQSVGGGEFVRGKQVEANIRWVINGTWGGAIKGVSQTMRVVVTAGEYLGRILNIERVLPTENSGKPHELDLHCTEKGS